MIFEMMDWLLEVFFLLCILASVLIGVLGCVSIVRGILWVLS